jgi:hypothetical protein
LLFFNMIHTRALNYNYVQQIHFVKEYFYAILLLTNMFWSYSQPLSGYFKEFK